MEPAGHAVPAHRGPEPTDEEWEQLAARDIEVVDGEVVGLEIVDDRLAGVRFGHRPGRRCTALALLPRMVAAQRRRRPSSACSAVEHPLGIGSQLAADRSGLTVVPGVWVAGNVGNLLATVIGAAAEGVTAAAAINADLVAEDTRLAVERRRDPFSAAPRRPTASGVRGDRRHGLTPTDA